MDNQLDFGGCVELVIAAIELARRDAVAPKGTTPQTREHWQRDAQLFLNALGAQPWDNFVDAQPARSRRRSVRWM